MSSLSFDLTTASLFLDSSEQFPVDFDRAWQWIGYTRKDNAKTSLLNSGFTENVDYKISILNNKELRKQCNPKPRQVIHIAIEAFKMWAMMAGTEQGKQVRKYFLECERIAKGKATPSTVTSLDALQGILDQLRCQANRIQHQNNRLDILQSELAATDKIVTNNAKILTNVQDLAHGTSHLVDRFDRNVFLQSELDRLEHPYGMYYTILGWLNIRDFSLGKIKQLAPSEIARIGKRCTAECEKHRITIEQVYDIRYGTVGAYPETVIKNCIPHEFYI